MADITIKKIGGGVIQSTREYHTGFHKNHIVNITVHAGNYLPTKLRWLFCPLGRSCLFWQLTIMRLLPLADGLHSIYAVILSLVLRVEQHIPRAEMEQTRTQTRRRAREAKDRRQGTQETRQSVFANNLRLIC